MTHYIELSETLDPSRIPRKAFGLKAESSLNRITLNPSSANPGETLYVNIPKLTDNVVIIPGSVFLRFTLSVDGHANNTLVNNIGRNLVSRLTVKYGGEILQDTQRFDLYSTWKDLFLPSHEREDRLKVGISSVNMRKLRTNAGDKSTSNGWEVALAAVHATKYVIPLDHPILSDHGVIYPKVLPNPLIFEITLAQVSDVVVFSDTTKPLTYSLTNLELEYRCMDSNYLARQATMAYQVGRGFMYENVILHKTFTISKPNDSVLNQHINLPRRSMTGILCLFTEAGASGTRDSEKFVNPSITNVEINIDGMPNRLFSKGMVVTDIWDNVKRRFFPTGSKCEVTQKDFFTGNKYGLWIDLRTSPDNTIHGSGLHLNNTRDGVKLEIKRKTGGSGTIVAHMFVVADAIMQIVNADLKSIVY